MSLLMLAQDLIVELEARPHRLEERNRLFSVYPHEHSGKRHDA